MNKHTAQINGMRRYVDSPALIACGPVVVYYGGGTVEYDLTDARIIVKNCNDDDELARFVDTEHIVLDFMVTMEDMGVGTIDSSICVGHSLTMFVDRFWNNVNI